MLRKTVVVPLVFSVLALSACGSSQLAASPNKTPRPGTWVSVSGPTTFVTDSNLEGTPSEVETARSLKLAEEWACKYQDAVVASVVDGPYPGLFNRVRSAADKVASLSFQAATNAATTRGSIATRLYVDAQAQVSFLSSDVDLDLSWPEGLLNGSAPRAVMADCNSMKVSASSFVPNHSDV